MNCLFNGLSITLKTTLKVADSLAVHFELMQDICQPYQKPSDDLLHINKNSNGYKTDTEGYIKIDI